MFQPKLTSASIHRIPTGISFIDSSSPDSGRGTTSDELGHSKSHLHPITSVTDRKSTRKPRIDRAADKSRHRKAGESNITRQDFLVQSAARNQSLLERARQVMISC